MTNPKITPQALLCIFREDKGMSEIPLVVTAIWI